MPEVLAAAVPEDQTLTQLKDWVKVLWHGDNLEAVHACTPLCAAYSKSLSDTLLTAAKSGKHGAILLLAEVFRCNHIVCIQRDCMGLLSSSHNSAGASCQFTKSAPLLFFTMCIDTCQAAKHGSTRERCLLPQTVAHVLYALPPYGCIIHDFTGGDIYLYTLNAKSRLGRSPLKAVWELAGL